MAVVLVIAAGIWGLGWVLNAPVRARLFMIGLLFLAVIAMHLVLADGHPWREATGGSAGQWLVLGGIVGIVFLYRLVLKQVRARVDEVESERADENAAPSATFSGAELERYARHITLREIGGTGQRKLKAAKVLVVGAGGLGSPALFYLAAAGVGQVGIIDPDIVDLSNLQRQIIHTDQARGEAKVFSAMQRMKALNPHINIRPYNRALTGDIAPALFADYDLILDGTDSFAIRDLINRAAVSARKPVVSGAISAWEGQITIFDPANDAPCMACIFPQVPAPGLSATCSETGVIGALPGIIGAMMASEAIKYITGAGQTLTGRMLIFDALYAETRIIKVKRDPACGVCGT